MSLPTLAFAALAVFLAAIVRGFSGFGFALIAISSLSLVFEPAIVVPAIFVLELAAGLRLLPQIRGDVHWASLGPLLAGTLVATPFGVWLLATTPAAPLKIALGVVVVIAGTALASGWRFPRVPGPLASAGTGAAAGLLNGAFGIGGPPIILFFVGSPLGARIGRASIIAAFLAIDVVGLAMLAGAGLVGRASLVLAAVLIVPLVAGIGLGASLVGRLDEGRVRHGVLAILIGLAAATGLQGFLEWRA